MITTPQTSPSDTPLQQLRVFQPGSQADDRRERLKRLRRQRSESWTLRTLFDEFAIPRYFRSAERKRPAPDTTLKELRTSLAYWEAATGNPKIAAIRQCHCRRFRRWLNQQCSTALAERTQAKHVGNINFLLSLAGPPDHRRGKPGARLRPRPPQVTRVPYSYQPPRDGFTLDELQRLIEACTAARRPVIEGFSAAEWWRALLTVAHNTALRKQTLLGFTREMIDGDHWLHVPGEIFKRNREGFAVYLNRHARQAVDAVPGEAGQRVFRWEDGDSDFHEELRGLIAVAGIKRRPGVRKRGLGLHNIRKLTESLLARENPMVAKIVAGHRGDVTQEHYIDPSITAPYLDRLPQPTAAIQKQLF